MTEAIELNTDTLSGDVRAAILDKIRGTNMSWSMMPEGQQRTFAHEIDELARYVVREAVKLIAADGQPVIRAILGDVKKRHKDQMIEAKVLLRGDDEQRHELTDASGGAIIIVVADHAKYVGEQAPEKIEPDQRRLINDDE